MNASSETPEREDTSRRKGNVRRALEIVSLVIVSLVIVSLVIVTSVRTVANGRQALQADERRGNIILTDQSIRPSNQGAQPQRVSTIQAAQPLQVSSTEVADTVAPDAYAPNAYGQPRISYSVAIEQQVGVSERKSRELAAKLHQAQARDDAAQIASLLNELKAHLLMEFTERHGSQGKQLQAAQKRIDALRQTHEKRAALREEIVQRRIDELLGQPDVLQWDNIVNAGAPLTQPNPLVGGPGPGVRPPTITTRAGRQPVQVDRAPFNAINPAMPGSGFAGKPSIGAPIGRSGPARLPRSSTTDGTRISVVSSGNADVFGIARGLMTAKIDLRSAKVRLQELKQLAVQGAVTNTELVQAEIKLQSSEAEAAFAEAELAALESYLDREQAFAKSQLKRSLELAESAKTQFDNGITSTDSLLKSQSALAESEKAVETVDALQQQLKKALELIGTGSSAADGSVKASGTDGSNDKSKDPLGNSTDR